MDQMLWIDGDEAPDMIRAIKQDPRHARATSRRRGNGVRAAYYEFPDRSFP
jgi:hypothetical protein